MARLAALLALAGPALAAPDGNDAFVSAADRTRDGEVVIACLGDSNTAKPSTQLGLSVLPAGSGWCEKLEVLFDDPRIRTRNVAMGGATAVPNRILPRDAGYAVDGALQLEEAYRRSAPDVVLLAFGTNGVQEEQRASPVRVVRTLSALVRQVEERGGLALVATAPLPRPYERKEEGIVYRRDPKTIATLNDLVRRTFPHDRVLEFDEGFSDEDLIDDLHVNEAGHEKRAREAYAKLVGLLRRSSGGAAPGPMPEPPA